jgi:hypothetical protein
MDDLRTAADRTAELSAPVDSGQWAGRNFLPESGLAPRLASESCLTYLDRHNVDARQLRAVSSSSMPGIERAHELVCRCGGFRLSVRLRRSR